MMRFRIIHKELSYRVNGCIFDVHNEVGPGLREECYQKALEIRLLEAGVQFVPKPGTRTEFFHRGVVVSVFEPDLLVADQLVVELKHQPEGFSNENVTQVLNYLKFWKLRLGLLVNFAMDKAVIERVPFDPHNAEIDEEYEHIRETLKEQHRPILQRIRASLIEIGATIGVGYSAPTYRNLAIVEFRSHGLTCDSEFEVAPTFRERRLPHSPISPIVVDRRVCVQIEAIYDRITARAIRTMQTHIRLAGCDLGIIACYGKRKIIIRGVRP